MIFALALQGALTFPPLLYRVDDPTWPGALARSERGAVLERPPLGVSWSSEPFADIDAAEEGVGVLNADRWQSEGWSGAGVKVAVFDLQWFGAEAHVAELGEFQTWDCWASPTCEVPIQTFRPTFSAENGGHGWACAEVVRAVAPEVELHLVRVNGRTTLENAVAWALRHDIDLISMSLSFFGQSFSDGTGPVSEAMAPLRAADVLMVTSAGNYARGHWEGPWRDGDLDGRLDFGGENRLLVELGAGRAGAVVLAWDQFRSCGASDLDLRVVTLDGQIVARAEEPQDPTGDHCEPVERLNAVVEESGVYAIEVWARRGQRADLRVDLFAKDGRIPEGVPAGSVVDPGTSPDVLTVGAAPADAYLLGPLESFSSLGPTKAGLLKPDLIGPDGLSTSFYGAQGFYGTSASTPAVVGALALILEANPDKTPLEAAEMLKGWAYGATPAPAGLDRSEGWGRARLPAEAAPPGCGRGALWAGLALFPWWGSRRRRQTATLKRSIGRR